MNLVFSDLILKFQDQLGVSKEMMEETFNKPDATDSVLDKYISYRIFGNFLVLVVFEMDGQFVRFLNAYRIYPQLMDGFDISRAKPMDLLKEFMNRYGIAKVIPRFGEQKFLIVKDANVFFPGILDMEKYLEAVERL